MKKLNSIVIAILIVVISIGGYGCMKSDFGTNINSLDGKALIMNYLKDKYDDNNFEIKDLYRETNGNDGSYFRAVCENKKYKNERFAVYAYLNGSSYILDEIDDVKKMESENEITFVDDYANVIVSNEYQEKLQALVGDEFIVKCNIVFYDQDDMFTDDELDKGYAYCISIPEKDVFVKIFLMAPSNIGLDSAANTIIEETKKYNSYGQYLYACRYSCEKEQLLNDYYDNYADYDNYICDFADYVVSVDYFANKRGENGVVRKNLKGN